MVVDQVQIQRVAVLEPEDDPSVAADGDGPETLPIAFQRVQPVTGEADFIEPGPGIQDRKHLPHALDQSSVNPAAVVSVVEPPQAPMPEASDHDLIVG